MPPPVKRPKRNTGPWSSGRILNQASPIADKDIRAFLITCITRWDAHYDESEKRAIIDTLPPSHRRYEVDEISGKLRCPVSVDFVANDPFLKRAVFRFKTDVTDGYHEKPWQNKARKAMQARRDGKFDGYLKQHVEDMFGEGPVTTRDDASAEAADELASSDGEFTLKRTAVKRENLAR